ncbi:hypothetical protein F5883DRAFT_525493 [Diaporthe sp. PMI_573]|nr:hypothetical protein F5883DRAFT_525493 [Diaporthaceae sp. PMI_573]
MTEISKPLSELVKGEDPPMLDIESYVHRPECERKDEVEKGKAQGRVKRPLNAFMLDQLQSFLADHDGCHESVITSLALGAHGRSQTGTVTFRSGTRLLKTVRGGLQPGVDTTTLIYCKRGMTNVETTVKQANPDPR